MAEQFTFAGTRGRLQDYGDAGAVLKVLALGSVVIDNDDPAIVSVDDIDADEVTGGTYARQTLTGVTWDTSGDESALQADDITIEGLDVDPETVGAVVAYVDNHPIPDRIGELVAGIRFDPINVVGDLPVRWAEGKLATLDESTDESGGSTVTRFDELADVDATGDHAPEDGQAPLWDAGDGVWRPGTVAGGGGGGLAGAVVATITDGVADVKSLVDAGNYEVTVQVASTPLEILLPAKPTTSVGQRFVVTVLASAMTDISFTANGDPSGVSEFDNIEYSTGVWVFGFEPANAGGGTFLWLGVPQASGAVDGAPLSDDDPEPPGAADPGVSASASRSDHVHAPPTAGQIGAATATDIDDKIDDHVAATDPHGDRAYAVQRSNHTGTQTMSTISDAGTAATKDVAASGDASSSQVVKGNDSRLSDDRAPTAAGLAAKTHAATNKATPADADEFPIADSAASYALKNTTWASIKATLLTWLAGLGIVAPTIVNLGSSLTGTVNLDLSSGRIFYGTRTGNVTWTVSNVPSGYAWFSLVLTQDSTPRTDTWPASFKFSGGVVPTGSTASGARDRYEAVTLDGGTTWHVHLVGRGYA